MNNLNVIAIAFRMEDEKAFSFFPDEKWLMPFKVTLSTTSTSNLEIFLKNILTKKKREFQIFMFSAHVQNC